MAADTSAKLDQTSRRTIGRFVVKLIVAFLVAHLLSPGQGYAKAVSTWLSYYALFAIVGGLLVKDAFARRSLNYWDEATWLLLLALVMHIIGRAAA